MDHNRSDGNSPPPYRSFYERLYGDNADKVRAEHERRDRARQRMNMADGAARDRQRGGRRRRRTTTRPAAGTWTREAAEACLLAILRLLIDRPELVLALLEILRRGGKGAGR